MDKPDKHDNTMGEKLKDKVKVKERTGENTEYSSSPSVRKLSQTSESRTKDKIDRKSWELGVGNWKGKEDRFDEVIKQMKLINYSMNG